MIPSAPGPPPPGLIVPVPPGLLSAPPSGPGPSPGTCALTTLRLAPAGIPTGCRGCNGGVQPTPFGRPPAAPLPCGPSVVRQPGVGYAFAALCYATRAVHPRAPTTRCRWPPLGGCALQMPPAGRSPAPAAPAPRDPRATSLMPSRGYLLRAVPLGAPERAALPRPVPLGDSARVGIRVAAAPPLRRLRCSHPAPLQLAGAGRIISTRTSTSTAVFLFYSYEYEFDCFFPYEYPSPAARRGAAGLGTRTGYEYVYRYGCTGPTTPGLRPSTSLLVLGFPLSGILLNDKRCPESSGNARGS